MSGRFWRPDCLAITFEGWPIPQANGMAPNATHSHSASPCMSAIDGARTDPGTVSDHRHAHDRGQPIYIGTTAASTWRIRALWLVRPREISLQKVAEERFRRGEECAVEGDVLGFVVAGPLEPSVVELVDRCVRVSHE